jgi:hypothetical protein
MGETAVNSTSTSSAFSSNVIPLPSANSRLQVIEPDYSWRNTAITRLEKLVREPVGWDGYSAIPVSLLNANFALRMLDAICGSGAAAPQIVPGLEGDLQIEWHTIKGDVELHVLGPNRVHGWRRLVGPVEREDELELEIEFSAVAAWVREITEQPRAPNVAAA